MRNRQSVILQRRLLNCLQVLNMMLRVRNNHGSLFEQASLIFLDSVVLPLMDAFHISEKQMQENHANLE